MDESKWVVGNSYSNLRGEEFIYLGEERINDKKYHLVRFVETNNYQYVLGSILGNKSKMRDLSRPFMCGVGYATGTEERPFYYRENYQAFEIWENMLQRCYRNDGRNKSYRDAEVTKEWHNYSNFLSWFNSKVYDSSYIWEWKLQLDKDLLSKDGKKVYSPETCCFLPSSINSILASINFKEYTKNCAKNVCHLREMVRDYGGVIEDKVRSIIYSRIDEYASNFYKKTGFTLNELFTDNLKEKSVIGEIPIAGYLEYNGKVYKLSSLSSLKGLVELIESNVSAKIVARKFKSLELKSK